MTGAKYGSTFAEQWAAFAAASLHASAPALQRRDMRRAFYAGAQATFELLKHAVSDGPDVTEDDEAVMRAFDAEIRQFIEDVKAGRA